MEYIDFTQKRIELHEEMENAIISLMKNTKISEMNIIDEEDVFGRAWLVRSMLTLDITWMKQGSEEEEHTLAELMATIKEQSLNISSAVSELEKLLSNIKED